MNLFKSQIFKKRINNDKIRASLFDLFERKILNRLGLTTVK